MDSISLYLLYLIWKWPVTKQQCSHGLSLMEVTTPNIVVRNNRCVTVKTNVQTRSPYMDTTGLNFTGKVRLPTRGFAYGRVSICSRMKNDVKSSRVLIENTFSQNKLSLLFESFDFVCFWKVDFKLLAVQKFLK